MGIRVPVGLASYGHIERRDGEIATRFVHVGYLPILPVGGLRAVSSSTGGPVFVAAPMKALSVLAAYWKAWGFLGACGIGALVFTMVQSPAVSPEVVIGAMQLALAFMALVTLSWLWLGMLYRPPRAMVISLTIGIPSLLLYGAFGVAMVQRAERSHWAAYRKEEPSVAALPTVSPSTGGSATTSTVAAFERAEEVRHRVRSMLIATYEAGNHGFHEATCPTGTLKLAPGASPEVLHGDYAYLQEWTAALRVTPSPPVQASRWLTSSALVTFEREGSDQLAAQLDQIALHPYTLIVWFDETVAPKRARKKWAPGRIAGHFIVFETGTAKAVCTSGAVEATYAPASLKTTDRDASIALAAAFKRQVAAGLARTAPGLTIDFASQ